MDNETGLLVDEDNPQECAEALLKILTDENLAYMLGEKGKVHVRGYSWDGFVEKFVEIYKEILNR